MANKQTDIDCMKYRNHTHLAGIDVETIVAEKGQCILTIKECYYEEKVAVSGNATNGYFIIFNEPVKPMVVNSTNRKTIAGIVKDVKQLGSTDSRNIGNWAGITIELTFDPTIVMMGKVVGGIVVVPPKAEVIDDTEALRVLNTSTTLAELQTNWKLIGPKEQRLMTVLALKEKLKNELK
jgi:hypothetical protein